ncbi:MAG: maleylpyruvate isomerase N-terminal domain-containing protein [Actinomycetota bacterium]|nr:maleylpyruvate isomerase N-terminal domain-containing protein [Actinomycetota bacterium]
MPQVRVLDAEVVRFEGRAVRGAFGSAGRHLVATVAALGGIDEAAWHAPALGTWTLHDLVGHAGRALRTVVVYLDAGRGRAVDVAHAFDYYPAVFRSAHVDPASIAERARAAAAELGDDPVAGLEQLLDEAVAAVAAAPDDAPVATPAGVMRLVDYLPSRIVELVVHAEDVGVATGTRRDVPGDAAAVALHVVADLAVRVGEPRELLFGLTGRGGLDPRFSVFGTGARA